MTTTFQNISRWLFSLPLFAFGLGHYMNADMMQMLVPSYMPFGGLFWVYASGTSLILAGTGIAIKKWDRLAALCLAPTIFAFALMVHLPKVMQGDPFALPNFLKDFMIGSACLMYASFITHKKF